MSTTYQNSIPTISPVLFYEDLEEAILWLTEAFGFSERVSERVTLENGRIVHSELALGDGMIILSSVYDKFQVPAADSVHHHCLYVSVEDAQSHKTTSIGAGATLIADIIDTDYGARVYSVTDLAGYHWIFAQTLRHADDA